MDFKQLIGVLKARWLLVMFVSVFFTAAIGAYSFLYTQPVYEASAKLILTIEQAQGDGLSYNSILANGMLIQTYGEIVKTPRLMDKVVISHPELGMTSNELIARVSAKTSDNQIMSIVVQDPSYDTAAAIANAVADGLLTEIPQIIKVNNLFLLDKAQDDTQPSPINMSPEIKTAIAFIISVLLGSGLALIRDYMDDRIRSVQDIEQTLGLKALAAMPKLKKSEAYPLIYVVPEKTGEQTYVTVSP